MTAAVGVALAAALPPAPAGAQAPTPADYRRAADDALAGVRRDVLSCWFPRAVDSDGGFHQDFAADWARRPGDTRSLVYQARLTWVAARAAQRFPADAATYRGYARHGLAFLRDRMWDREHGGLFWSVDRASAPAGDHGGEKHAYGTAFGIYAASEAYSATRDAAALDLAKRTYLWLDAHAHDREHGGYYEALARDGKPILAATASGGRDAIGTAYGLKSMNTHIHLLEALTALYGVWPDAGVRARLEEVFGIVRDRVAAESGYLVMFFRPDWTPEPGADSYGHDVETAYLLTEAAAALGRPRDARTWQVARRLVDHALKYGWDEEHGGFYDEGEPSGAVRSRTKIWWVEAEGLNALLLMHERYGRESGAYWNAFERQWGFVRDHQVDKRNGGWFPYVSADGSGDAGQRKSDGWTEAYHQGRALFNVEERLRRMAGKEGRTAGVWTKYDGNPVLGGELGTCFDIAVLREGGRYRMWFSWRPKKSVALVESEDGIHWSAPAIALGPNAESGWEDDVNRPVVVRRTDGYHMWYTGQARGQSWIGYATSPDGKTWKRMSARPALSPDAPWEKVAVMCPDVAWDAQRKLYRMWYSGGEQYEPDAIGYAESPDGLAWTKRAGNPIFAADPAVTWEAHKVTACQVVQRAGWHYMFYVGFRDVDHAQIGLARSRDGLTKWERYPGNPIVGPTPDGWDHDACYKPYALFDGKRWLLWYNGRHGDREQIGLVTREGEGLW